MAGTVVLYRYPHRPPPGLGWHPTKTAIFYSATFASTFRTIYFSWHGFVERGGDAGHTTVKTFCRNLRQPANMYWPSRAAQRIQLCRRAFAGRRVFLVPDAEPTPSAVPTAVIANRTLHIHIFANSIERRPVAARRHFPSLQTVMLAFSVKPEFKIASSGTQLIRTALSIIRRP